MKSYLQADHKPKMAYVKQLLLIPNVKNMWSYNAYWISKVVLALKIVDTIIIHLILYKENSDKHIIKMGRVWCNTEIEIIDNPRKM